MSDTNDNTARARRRRQRRSYALLPILAAGLIAFAAAAGTLYYVLRPTTLRIAVGPAGSEDQKLVQLMAQTFARENSAVRLSLVATEGTAESIALFTAGKADLAVATRRPEFTYERGVGRDPAQECRRAVDAFRPSHQGLKKARGIQDQDKFSMNSPAITSA